MARRKAMDERRTTAEETISKRNTSGEVSVWRSISNKVYLSLALVVLSFFLLVHFWGRPTQSREIDINLFFPKDLAGCTLLDWMKGAPDTSSSLSPDQAQKKNWLCYDYHLLVLVGGNAFIYRGAGVDETGNSFLVYEGGNWDTHKIKYFFSNEDRLRLYLEYSLNNQVDSLIMIGGFC